MNEILVSLLNVRSINNKETELQEMIKELNIDILCLTETWLTNTPVDDIIIKKMLPNDYIFIKESRTTGRGGGIGFVIRKSIKVIETNKSLGFKTFEAAMILLQFKKLCLRLITIYRPPSRLEKEFIQEFHEFLNDIVSENGIFLINGDFNIPIKSDSNNSNNLLNLLDMFNLKNVVKSSTHNKGNILDLVICNENERALKEVYVDHSISISDHFLINMKLRLERECCEEKKIVEYRNFNNFNRDNFSIYIKSMFQNTLRFTDASCYNKILKCALDEFVPIKKVGQKKTIDGLINKWYDKEVCMLRRERRKYESIYRKNKTEDNKQTYIRYRNKVTSAIKRKKTEYFNVLFERNRGDPKMIFNSLKKLYQPNVQENKIMNNPLSENKFAQYFQEKISKIIQELGEQNGKLKDNFQCYETHCQFNLEKVSEDYVKHLIKNMKNKTCALDPIPTFLVKDKSCIDEINPIITDIINESIESNVFPEVEKNAIVRPILKNNNGSSNDLKNYRPVSNLSFLSKIIEKVVANQLTNFLEYNDIICNFQSAYRSNYSTETALIKVMNDVFSSRANNKCVLLVMLDLSAAFDTVNHKLLLEDLKRCGISNGSLSWFASYLENRKLRIFWNNRYSQEMTLKTGVPQGSILGPILFLIYINDVKDILEKYDIKYHLYADDIQFYIEFDPIDTEDVFQIAEFIIIEVKEWLRSKYLKLNESKTECIVLGNKKQVETVKLKRKSLRIKNDEITLKSCLRNVGFYIDDVLNFNQQIQSIVKCCNFHLTKIKKIRNYLSKEVTETLIHAVVTSRVDFQNSLLMNVPMIKLYPLQMVLNKAARLVFRLKRRDHISRYLKKLHWLPIKARIEFKIILLIQKCLLKNRPKYLHNLMKVDNRNYMKLRKYKTLFYLKRNNVRNNIEDRAFGTYSSKLYNSLPISVKNEMNIENFKKKMKTYLFEKYLE
ncbi:MAG TPA: hypothetical protein DDZ39_00730 [Flavobacteriaceae bacterium]|nr:hypothetical protein [Flavobacteriaceae bacterium]